MENIDLLVCPATSVTAVDARLRYPGSDSDVPITQYYRWLAIVYAVTVCALPVITLPVSMSSAGLPGGEARLVQHAKKSEALCGQPTKPVDPVSHE